MKTNTTRYGLVRLARYLWNYKITPPGRFLIAGFIMSASVGSTSLDMPLYQLFCALFALIFVTFLTGLFVRPRIKIEGQLTSKTITGHTIEGNFTVKNLSGLPAFNISVGFFGLSDSITEIMEKRTVFDLKPGETTSVKVYLHAIKRGSYSMPNIQPYSTFPFNIFRNGSAGNPVDTLLVLPHFQPVTNINIPVNRRYQPGGITLTSQIGESLEYIGNRDYRPGDSLREIDFRSWGRLGKPIVKEYQEEYYCRIALVIDTFVPPETKFTREGCPELEAAISLCATVADVLAKTEYIIDLFAVGPELYLFRAGRNTAHFENVLEILACLEATKKNPFDTLTPAIVDELSGISTVICVFLNWDESRKRLLQKTIEVGCKTKILLVSKDDTPQALADIEELADSVSVHNIESIRNGNIEVL